MTYRIRRRRDSIGRRWLYYLLHRQRATALKLILYRKLDAALWWSTFRGTFLLGQAVHIYTTRPIRG